MSWRGMRRQTAANTSGVRARSGAAPSSSSASPAAAAPATASTAGSDSGGREPARPKAGGDPPLRRECENVWAARPEAGGDPPLRRELSASAAARQAALPPPPPLPRLPPRFLASASVAPSASDAVRVEASTAWRATPHAPPRLPDRALVTDSGCTDRSSGVASGGAASPPGAETDCA